MQPLPSPRRFSRKVLLIITIVAGVALLSGVGIAAAAAFRPHTTTQTTPNTASQNSAAQNDTNLTNVLGDKKGNGEHDGIAQVTAINGKTLTITPGDATKKGKETTITVSDQTKITKYGQSATLGDIHVGDFVHIHAKSAQEVRQIDILGVGAAGTILALSDGGFSLQTVKSGTVTVSVAADTQILEEPGQQLSLNDLQPGEEVQVFGDKTGDSAIAARLVHVRLFHGQVSAISGTTITVTVGNKQKTGTVLTNDKTTYYVADQSVPASTLLVGDRIAVAGPLSADKTSITAVSIFIQKDEVSGKVTAISGNTITLQDKSGATWTITVNSATKYVKQDRSAAALSDVQVGDAIRAVGLKNGDHALTALVIGIATPKK